MLTDTVSFKPHDLIRFDASFLQEQDLPDWIVAMEGTVTFAVIRRAEPSNGALPIGIRGPQRFQRWGGWLDRQAILDRWTPESLVARISELPDERLRTVPALSGLIKLRERLAGSPWQWGPTGSVGFELATGLATATHSSDLDLLVRCDMPITQQQACCLVDQTQGLGMRCDIALETPLGAVALVEFARTDGAVAIKTATGPKLMTNPWVE
jgi:phosphoribosyl-dephospho-CoA transferase